MKSSFRSILLAFGIIALAIMVWLVDIPAGLSWKESRNCIIAIIAVWGVVYALNATAFKVIVDTVSPQHRLPFFRSYKLTVSAFAYTFITPFGFAGGPYRVLELSRFIGMPRAISSVTLYSLMHILGHFLQWTTCVIVFIVAYTDKMTPFLWTLFGIYMALFATVVVVFNWFYTNGLLARLFRIFFHIPGLRSWSRRFYAKNEDAFRLADENVAYLKKQPRAFYLSILCEYGGRLLNVMEFWFILAMFNLAPVTYIDALLITGFSSLIANILYLLPLQLGSREGGLVLIMRVLYGSAMGTSIFVSFCTRICELFWVAVGVGVVKIANTNLMKKTA
ncbi:MAG: flippase-like domain-containing protein [Bacteroidales bacterium]|nr:flippase-like domain-containing protein [Candidatus Equimonas faecalis]